MEIKIASHLSMVHDVVLVSRIRHAGLHVGVEEGLGAVGNRAWGLQVPYVEYNVTMHLKMHLLTR